MNFRSGRRSFFKYSAAVITPIAATLFSNFLNNDQALAAQSQLPPVNPNDPLAKTLGYSADARKVDTKKWPKKAGAGGADQRCDQCMFFMRIDKGTGRCQTFAQHTVKAGGWCNSWTKKHG